MSSDDEILEALSNQVTINIVRRVSSLVEGISADNELSHGIDSVFNKIAEKKSITNEDELNKFLVGDGGFNAFMNTQLPSNSIFDGGDFSRLINLTSNYYSNETLPEILEKMSVSKLLNKDSDDDSDDDESPKNMVPQVLVGQIFVLFKNLNRVGEKLNYPERRKEMIFTKMRTIQFIGCFFKYYFNDNVTPEEIDKRGGRPRRTRARISKRRRSRMTKRRRSRR